MPLEFIKRVTRGTGFSTLNAFAEDTTTGEILPPMVHVLMGDDASDQAFINLVQSRPHYNLYLSAAKLRVPPPPGRRGCEADIEHVAFLVADFDDLDAANWSNRIPHAPSWVLETSPGRFQVGFLFDRPVTPEEAKPLAKALKAFCRCDHGTADIAHVWRIPGTINWPNVKKHREGRVPCLVHEVALCNS